MGWRDWFGKQTKDVRPILATAIQNFERAYGASNPLLGIVPFFEATSSLQDNAAAIEAAVRAATKDPKTLSLLDVFRQDLRSTGRNTNRMNRSQQGEAVTVNNIYLGEKFGLQSQSLSEWLGSEYKDPNYHGPDTSTNPGFNPVAEEAKQIMDQYKILVSVIRTFSDVLNK